MNIKRNFIFLFTIIFSSIYLIWRIFFTIPMDGGFWQTAAGMLLVGAETTTMLGMFELMISKMRSGKKVLYMPCIKKEEYPDVDVLIATHNEPGKLLYKTINACMFLEYPDPEKVHVYVCDDGNRAEIKELAQKLGAGYLGMKENIHAKSGNYNHALSKTSSPLIATFDADMIPRRKFLKKTVPYFFIQDCPVGLIQTPQSFYNHDLFQFNLYSEKDIPNEQDFFSREINIMRNSSNSSAYTGSNTVILRKALEEIGGFPYGTITEDFETSLRLQKAGYITYATDEVLASGLSTNTVSSMVSQRIRWARGVIQSIQNTNAVFTAKLPLSARLSYLNAYLYWWSFFNRMVFILAPICFALFGFQLVKCGFWDLVVFWLPSHLLYNLSVRYLSTNVRTMRWSQIIDTILAPYLIVPVLLESLGIHQLKFKVTQKEKTGIKTTSFRFIIPHAILVFFTLAAIFKFAKGKYGMSLVYSSVILFWLFYNLLVLSYAILFMLGRESKRQYERFQAEEIICLKYGKMQSMGKTIDISEQGIAFRLYNNIELHSGDNCFISVKTKYYKTELCATIVHVKEEEKFWAAVVIPKDEHCKRHWLQIIHDREHSLPKEIDPWLTVYDDICRNVKFRYRDWKRRR